MKEQCQYLHIDKYEETKSKEIEFKKSLSRGVEREIKNKDSNNPTNKGSLEQSEETDCVYYI